ncbi:MAG: DUF6786 family protein [Chitinophagaceae bacterium]
MNKISLVIFLMAIVACNNAGNKAAQETTAPGKQEYAKGEFGYDLNRLRQYHPDLVLLGDDSSGAQVIVLPAYQGRVMTSTAAGNSGASFGWINHDLIASGKPAEHMSAFGGEDRFWLGPEGGQFSIFFKKGTAFTFENWFVPREFDTEPFTTVAVAKTAARFRKEMHLENHSGNKFDLEVNREVRLLGRAATDSALGIAVPEGVQSVAFESENSVINKGATAWTKKTGLLSIWILSMLNASGKTTVALPYKQDAGAGLGKIVTDDYFGKVPADRLKVKDGLILFKADGHYRSKIGMSPARALPLIASYDAVNSVLTIAQFTLPVGARDYVNSLWKLQDDPFSGDAVNSYNDGPIDGKQMGNFYEMESSSPAAALKPGETIRHLHRTIHLKGDKKDLDKIALQVLGVSVDAIAL